MDKCATCGGSHIPTMPHDLSSSYYENQFWLIHRRPVTLEDAMAHCSEGVKELWRAEMKYMGVDVGRDK